MIAYIMQGYYRERLMPILQCVVIDPIRVPNDHCPDLSETMSLSSSQ